MSNNTYNKGALTGGASGSLDSIDGANLSDGDRAVVITESYHYHYYLDADSADAESSPSVIEPDSNAGDKRWVLTDAKPAVVTVYDTVTDMKAEDSALVDDSTVLLLGYHTVGDGGGGTFYWDNSSTDTADDGVIIKATSIATGRFKRIYSGWINVRWYGAKGDASNDDTAEIQAAIDLLSNGGVVYFPLGDYKISTTLNVDTAGIILVGDHADTGRSSWGEWPSRIYWAGSDNDDMIIINSASAIDVRGCGIEKLVIDAQATTGVRPLNVYTKASHGHIRDCVFRKFESAILLGTSCTGWMFDRVELFDIASIGVDLPEDCHHTTFLHCKASTTDTPSGDSVVRIGSTDHNSQISFINCDFEHKGLTYQIDAQEVRGLNISGGYFEGNDAQEAVIRLGKDSRSVSVDGCFISGTYFNCANVINYVLDIEKATNVHMTGCHCRNYVNAVIHNSGGNVATNSTYLSNYDEGDVFQDDDSVKGFYDHVPVQIKLFDDNATSITLNDGYARLDIMMVGADMHGGTFLVDVTGGVAAIDTLASNGTVQTTTGALTGTTGNDASLNISAHTDGKLYIENRIGSVKHFLINLNQSTGAQS